jgi:endo-1,4-beta-xylanase
MPMVALNRISVIAAALVLCTCLPSAGWASPPHGENLVLWFDTSSPGDLATGPGNAVLRWDNRAPSPSSLALFPGAGTTPPVLLPATDAFGDTLWFDGDSVLELREETSPGNWDPASFTTTDGLAVFVVSRASSVSPGTDAKLQFLMGWTQGAWRNGLIRPRRLNDAMPVAYPDGDAHLYYGHGSPIFITQVLVGSKISSTGTFINRVSEAEISEILFYDRGFTDEEREEILLWLHARHGLSTDTTNPTASRDPRFTPLKAFVREESGFQIAAAGNTNFFRVDADISKLQELDRYACTEATLERHYQLITPTNDFKMSRVAPDFSDDDLTVPHDWSVTDPYIEWAHARGIDWHGHVLVWHNGIPASLVNNTWLGGAWTEAQVRTLMTDHISEMIGRYTPEGPRADISGTVKVWDVVNEAIAPAWNHVPDPTDPSDWQETLRSSIWHDGNDGPGGRPGLGPGFIAEAFTLARTASGSDEITLLYNDFSADELNVKSDAIYKMCVDLLDQGVPIDGIGLQMHLNIYGLDLDSFRANIERFRALRGGTFEVHITELDIGIPGLVTREKLEAQGQLFHDITLTALEAGANSLHTWGIHDIWTSVERGTSAGLPFSTVMRLSPETPFPGPLPADHPSRRLSFIEPKPAFYGILEALKTHFGTAAKSLPLHGFTHQGGNTFSMTVETDGAGILDVLASTGPGSTFHPVGIEGQWESRVLETSGDISLSFTDPLWNGTARFWKIIFSARN